MNSNAISARGFFSLLFISRTLSAALHVVSTEDAFSDSDLIIRSMAAIPIVLVTALPGYWYVKRFKDKDAVDMGMSVSPVFGKAIAALYWLSAIYIALRILSRYDLFASSVMFPETDMSLFLLILIIACAYASSLGLRALGRSSLILLIMFIGVTALTLFAVIPEIKFLNMTPLFTDGTGVFLKDCVVSASYSLDIGLIPFFMSRIKGDIRKPFFIWLIASAFFVSVVSFFVVTTLGEYANTQLFPSFSVSSLAKIGTFERLDSLETSLWLSGMVLKLSFLLFICTDAFCMVFPRAKRLTGTAFSAAFLAVASTLISQSTRSFSFIFMYEQLIFVYIVIVIFVPLTVIAAKSLKERKKRREAVV